tara:strand:+ start:465 stop:650 length:186 start_codon:yes stop_codon:yes gene_type:complete
MKLDRDEIDKMDEIEIQKQILINTLESKESLNGVRRILNFYLIITILFIIGSYYGSLLSGV